MVLRVGKSFLLLSKLGGRKRSNLVYLALVNFSSRNRVKRMERMAIIFHPPCVLVFLFVYIKIIKIIKIINLYSHTNYVIVCAPENLTLRIFPRTILQTHAFIILSSIKRELILCNNFVTKRKNLILKFHLAFSKSRNAFQRVS